MNFTKLDGLIPAVVQDAETAEVLMVGFMNDAALAATRRTGFVTFFSRTRGALWTKGETSGNRLHVQQILVDCDDDTVLLKVRRLGEGNVCHTGNRSCFFRELAEAGADGPGVCGVAQMGPHEADPGGRGVRTRKAEKPPGGRRLRRKKRSGAEGPPTKRIPGGRGVRTRKAEGGTRKAAAESRS